MSDTDDSENVGPADPEGLAKDLLSWLDKAQDEQSAGWESVLAMQAATQILFQREALRVEARLGADDPRVRELKTRIQANAFLFKGAEAAGSDALVRTPPAVSDAAVIHGRIVDDAGRGLDGLRVQWEDEKGQVLGILGQVQTDAAGSFTAALPAPAVLKLPPSGAFLVVRNPAGALLHREAAPLQPVLGGKTAVSILLNRRTPEASTSTVFTSSPRAAEGPAAKPGNPDEPFRVRGKVVTASGRPAPDLPVTAWDRDRLFDDNLGSTLTGDDGTFSFTYVIREFSEGGIGPNLYLTVTDSSGRELHRTPVRANAGRDEAYDIVLPPDSGDNPNAAIKPAVPPTGASKPASDQASASSPSKGQSTPRPLSQPPPQPLPQKKGKPITGQFRDKNPPDKKKGRG
jgi:hypothetical protein